ncbi:MAG: hypothetical protein GY791_06790 [Alphaproteobacteria bacterium]|nr:hypothetical protein [Alphaproteobacteria bacterium]
MRLFALLFATTVTLVMPHDAGADTAKAANFFASVYIDDDKVGQIHLTETRGDNDDVETLKSNASMSVLGIDVYSFTQTIHEDWEDGELQSMHAETDDDGTKYEATVKRTKSGYEATLNGKPVELPVTAFPSAFWHYGITTASAIFDMKDLSVWQVSVSKKNETLKSDKQSIETERFDFTGSWKASLWFNTKKELVQFENTVSGHEVKVVLER